MEPEGGGAGLFGFPAGLLPTPWDLQKKLHWYAQVFRKNNNTRSPPRNTFNPFRKKQGGMGGGAGLAPIPDVLPPDWACVPTNGTKTKLAKVQTFQGTGTLFTPKSFTAKVRLGKVARVSASALQSFFSSFPESQKKANQRAHSFNC